MRTKSKQKTIQLELDGPEATAIERLCDIHMDTPTPMAIEEKMMHLARITLLLAVANWEKVEPIFTHQSKYAHAEGLADSDFYQGMIREKLEDGKSYTEETSYWMNYDE